MRIELTALAWEARVLPLYDAREGAHSMRSGALIQSLLTFMSRARSGHAEYLSNQSSALRVKNEVMVVNSRVTAQSSSLP